MECLYLSFMQQRISRAVFRSDLAWKSTLRFHFTNHSHCIERNDAQILHPLPHPAACPRPLPNRRLGTMALRLSWRMLEKRLRRRGGRQGTRRPIPLLQIWRHGMLPTHFYNAQ